MRFKVTLLASILAFSATASESSSDTEFKLPSLPVIDARAGRLQEQDIQPAPLQSSLPSIDFDRVQQQVAAATPQLASNYISSIPNSLYEKAVKAYKPSQQYDLDPMQSIIIPIGQGVMNSLVTNYNMVAVKTSDKNSIFEPENGYLYATLTTSQPVGLILFEEGVPESQIAVTLVPIDAPPAVVQLDVALSQAMKEKSKEFQKRVLEDQALNDALEAQTTYSDERTRRLVELLTPVAQGDLPAGFSLTSDIPAHYEKPCAIPIYQRTGQRIMGSREIIDVVLVKNTSQNTYQMLEERCLADDVIAVALYMKSYLQPNEEMEVYIVRDKHHFREKQRMQRRPRLVTGG